MRIRMALLLCAVGCLAGFLPAFGQALDVDNPIVTFPTLTYPGMGYYLLASVQGSNLALVDRNGYIVRSANAASMINFQESFPYYTNYQGGVEGYVVRDRYLNPVDTFAMIGDYSTDFHEGKRLANGNYLVLGTDPRTIDMSTLVHSGNPQAIVIGAIFQEQTPNGEVVFEWKSLDHIPVTDATSDIELKQINIDYIHVNSLDVDTDGNYLVSCRHLDEVIKVSRATGQILWRLGGQASKGNQFTWLNDSNLGYTGFSHQHNVHRARNGNLLMFDNGNMKPDPYSRAVEYKIDEQNRTVEAVWNYVHSVRLYASSLGSVQELPSGNILIGWGSAAAACISTEVGRNGELIMQMKADANVTSYRVTQSTLSLVAQEQQVDRVGDYTFHDGDSSTFVSMHVTHVIENSPVSVERHLYAPRVTIFNGQKPCSVLPIRWAVRSQAANPVAGNLIFNIKNIPNNVEPSELLLFRRPVEGQGPVEFVDVVYDADAGTLTTDELVMGEYGMAYRECLMPIPVSPAHMATSVSVPVHFTWQAAVQASGYEVEVSKAGATPNVVWSAIVRQNTDTTCEKLDLKTQYQWRIRSVNEAGNARWSNYFMFTTTGEVPVPIMPKFGRDTVAVAQHPMMQWKPVTGMNKYRVQIHAMPGSTVALDTLVSGAVLIPTKALEYARMYEWIVRVEDGTNISGYSAPEGFVVRPEPPVLEWPQDGEEGIFPDNVTLRWTGPTGFRDYNVVLRLDTSSSIWWEDTVRSFTVEAPVFPYESLVKWTVRTMGPYGSSDWAGMRSFHIVGAPLLAAPYLSSPRNGQTTAAESTTFLWTNIEGASSYTIQISTSTSFTNPEITLDKVTAPTTVITTLRPGIRYYWRVTANNGSVAGLWSEVAVFATATVPGNGLDPLVPADGEQDVPVTATFQFSMNQRFEAYRVEVAYDREFSRPLTSVLGSASPLEATLPGEMELYWRVIGMAGQSDVDTGAVNMFTTEVLTSANEEASAAGIRGVDVSSDGTMLYVRHHNAAIRSVVLFDVSGKEYARVESAGNDAVAITVAGLPTGVYLMAIETALGSTGMPIRLVR